MCKKAINAARAFAGHLIKIEVEVDTIAQLKQALKAKPDVVMLDNMSNKNLRKGVELVAGSIPVEASGNVSLQTIREIAETGVDMISTSKNHHECTNFGFGVRCPRFPRLWMENEAQVPDVR